MLKCRCTVPYDLELAGILRSRFDEIRLFELWFYSAIWWTWIVVGSFRFHARADCSNVCHDAKGLEINIYALRLIAGFSYINMIIFYLQQCF